MQWRSTLFPETNRSSPRKRCPKGGLKGYKRSNDEDGAENVILEGEQSQAHVGEDEVLSQEVEDFKQLEIKCHFLSQFQFRTS